MEPEKVDYGTRLVVMAPGATKKQMKKLRQEIEKSLLNPDYVTFTDFEFDVRHVEFGPDLPVKRKCGVIAKCLDRKKGRKKLAKEMLKPAKKATQ
jgi:hypothetical protein